MILPMLYCISTYDYKIIVNRIIKSDMGKKFQLYGTPYDSILFDYIEGTRVPSKDQTKLLKTIYHPLNADIQWIYRATDYEPLKRMKVGDYIEFDRFYSWTSKYNVALSLVKTFNENMMATTYENVHTS